MTTPAPPRSERPDTVQVRVPVDIWSYLNSQRQPGESLGDVVRRLLSNDKPDRTDDLPNL